MTHGPTTDTRADSAPSLASRLSDSRIPGLDGLRALAVMLVVVFHFGFDHVNGATGVLIFFVLSGFLITWLLLREHADTGGIGLGAFYKRRFLRLYPPLLAYLLLVLTASAVRGQDIDWGISFSALGYYTNYYLPFHQGSDFNLGHTWSLGVEEQFYLLWPLIVIALGASLRRLSIAAVALIVTVWILRASMYFAGVNHSYLYHSFETRFDELLIGCLLAITIKRGVHVRQLESLAARPWYPAVTMALLTVSSMIIQPSDPTNGYRYVLAWAIEPILAAVLIVQLILLSDRGVWRIFDSPVAQFLGRISYSIYLYQQLVLFTARRMTEEFPVAVQLVFAVAVTIVFASLSYYVVERPFRAARKASHDGKYGRSIPIPAIVTR